MSTAPEVLVGFGRSVELRGEAVTVTAAPGPGVPLRWGTLAIADPWFAPSVPEVQQIIPPRRQAETVAEVHRRIGHVGPVPGPAETGRSIRRLPATTSWTNRGGRAFRHRAGRADART
jgi:hypothetical protein